MRHELLPAFFELVKELRKTQKRYFKERGADTLRQSKALEKRVDGMILDIENTEPRLPASNF